MRGLISYIGGKSRLAPRLIELFPSHRVYVEPFAGGAQVFFRKPTSPVEVLNDLDGELVNLLRVCQLHHNELLRYLAYNVSSRWLYDLHRQQPPTLLTDIQRAARFLYIQRHSWCGRVIGQTFGYRTTHGPTSPSAVRKLIADAAKRLERVHLENWSYEKVLTRYDRPSTFFYCDPPYIGHSIYRFNFQTQDFFALAERLAALKGRFLLSLNDHPIARRAFARFHLKTLPVSYSTGHPKRASELVFANYPLTSQR